MSKKRDLKGHTMKLSEETINSLETCLEYGQIFITKEKPLVDLSHLEEHGLYYNIYKVAYDEPGNTIAEIVLTRACMFKGKPNECYSEAFALLGKDYGGEDFLEEKESHFLNSAIHYLREVC